MGKQILLIKLGGSSITDKSIPYKVREEVIRSLAQEIKSAGDSISFIISHGSGSFGHTSASKYGGKKGYESKIGIATVASDAARLNQIVTDIFVEVGLPAISISPMSMILAEKGSLVDHFFVVIEELIEQGLVPIIYGDVIWDKKWKSTIFSGEKTLNLIAHYLLRKNYKVDRVIQVGETKGLIDQTGLTIPRVTSKDWRNLKNEIYPSLNNDVTGGMTHKIEEALDLAKKRIETILISDVKKDLLNAIMRKPIKGTIIGL